MTGYKSKKAAARDRMIDDDDTQVYQDVGGEEHMNIEVMQQVLDAEFNRGYKEGARDAYARPWVGLTEEDLKAGDEPYFVAWREGARWAETYLKDKNNG